MRSLFLLLIVGALSVDVSAQVPLPTINRQQPLSQQFPQQITQPSSGIRELVQVWDTIFYWDWNIEMNQWELTGRGFDYQYDDNYEMIGGVGQSWTGSAWVNASMFTETTSEDGLISIWTGYTWTGVAWENLHRRITEQDPANNTTTWVSQDWVNGDWLNKYKFIILYNDDELMISETDLYWLDEGWVNAAKYIYFYDANNNNTMWKIQDWMGDNWVDVVKYALTYYPNNNVSGILEQYLIDNTWVNSMKDTLFTYDNQNNNTGSTTLWWINNEWVMGNKITSIYDDHNNSVSSRIWEWSDGQWLLTYRDTSVFTYDEHGFITGNSNKSYGSPGMELHSGDSTYYIYHTVITGNRQVSLADDSIAVWPNPGRGVFNISSNEVIRQMEVYDINGHLLRTIAAAGQSTRKIDLTDTPKGVYILWLQTDSGIYNQKIIKE